MGSRNGTFVNRKRIPSFGSQPIIVGSSIAFGDSSDCYIMLSDEPPRPMAIAEDERRIQEENGRIYLPTSSGAEVFFHRDGDSWRVRTSDGTDHTVSNGEAVAVDGLSWRLEIPGSLQTTQARDREWSLDELTLCFQVSRDLEHVGLELVDDAERLTLPPRVYWYTLLVLATRRLADQAQGISDMEQGWMHVEDVYREFKDSHDPADLLNHHVHRAKKVLSENGVRDPSDLVQRRKPARQIRLGVGRLEIRSS